MTTWTTGRCEANGIEIHYTRTGGAKPAVVLLHGLIGSGACWTPVARALEADYDLVMPDARGHGRSSTPPSGYRYEDLARDALGLVDALGLTAPALVGHSMGGLTAALVASRAPDAIRGAVLADPTFLSPERQREVFDSDVAGQHRRLLTSSKEELLADLRARHTGRSPELLELLAEARLHTRLAAFEVLRPPNPDYRALIGSCGAPMLLVTGDTGAVVSPETARELQALNQRLGYERIARAGHGLPYDQPALLAGAVRSFLEAL
jgi:N-formylmaleamate deformylase